MAIAHVDGGWVGLDDFAALVQAGVPSARAIAECARWCEGCAAGRGEDAVAAAVLRPRLLSMVLLSMVLQGFLISGDSDMRCNDSMALVQGSSGGKDHWKHSFHSVSLSIWAFQ